MAGKLATYHRKRDFKHTPEPKGSVAGRHRSLSFVIQKHAARSLHYDFRLELDGTLKSWAVPKGPSLDPADKRWAVHVEDHPLEYGKFEGIIPEGHYGAGKVQIWDRGTWHPIGDAAAGYRSGKLKFRLDGSKLHGGWTLVRTRLPGSGDKEQWLLIKERDEVAQPAKKYSITDAMPDSVVAPNGAKPRVGLSNKTNAKAQAPSARAKAGRKEAVPDAQLLTGARKAALPLELKPQARARKPGDAVAGIRITHPDRIIDKGSGFTKLDLARYYEQVAPWILPHLVERPVALVRGPDGAQGELFFQKHAKHLKIPGIRQLDPSLDPGNAALMMIDSVEALVGAAQFGAIELHTWNATAKAIEKPDRMIFDLDPDPVLKWNTVVEAARLTRSILEELGLRALVKSSGGRGLHVVVPLVRRNDWDEVRTFSQAVAQHLAATLPERFSAKMGEKNRVNKVFIDYLRNRRGASTVAAYSARARPGLPVSVPLEWMELDGLDPAAQWNIETLPGRLAAMKK